MGCVCVAVCVCVYVCMRVCEEGGAGLCASLGGRIRSIAHVDTELDTVAHCVCVCFLRT